MKRILFVDDEPKLLEGLQRMLRPERRQWDMMFAAGGEEALAVMEKTPVDVVVTDMRMPGMDGASLLQAVNKRYPGVMRIVLSGHFNAESGLRAVPVAHQFLTKPCDPHKLKAAIERSSQAEGEPPDEATCRLIGAIGALPSPPRTCRLLNEALDDVESSSDQIAKIISQDVALTAKVLQLVNSAFFSLQREVTDTKTAVTFLGIDVLKQLVLSAEILKTFRPVRPIMGFSLDDFDQHSQRAAKIANRLPAVGPVADLAATAALLHDTGKLVLATRLPVQFEKALLKSIRERKPLHVCETEVFGTTHAAIGAYLLNLWGLPRPAVDAIAHHHKPQIGETPPDGLDLRALVHIADGLAHESSGASAGAGGAGIGQAGIDMDYVTALGLADRMDEWRVMSREII